MPIYEDGQNILKDMEREICYDIYLLDVQLPEMNGLEIAKRIRRKFSRPIIIYITNYVNYAVEAYEVNTFRYIPKKLLEEKLPQAYLAMEPLLKKKKCYDRFYTIERYGHQEKIFYKDIFYLKKDRKYVVFVHKDGKSSVRGAMGEVLEKLQSKEFLMIDRSYIVNMDYVLSVKDYQVWIQNGDVLPVSKPKWPHVRDAFMNGGM